jgi:hypothetical protein
MRLKAPDRATQWSVGLALVGAAAWLIVQPHTADMAAQTFRSEYFADQGFQTWNPQWYGGHHLLPYSVLSPVAGGLLGVWLAGAVAAVLGAWALARAASAATDDRHEAIVASILLSLGALAALWSGRTTYLMGIAAAAACLAALMRGRQWYWWAPLAILTALISPVSALFLALCAFARLDRDGITTAVLALLPVAVISIVWGDGGWQPYSWKAFVPVAIACAVALWLTPRDSRAVRVAIGLYLLLNVGAFVVHAPIGSNAARLGQLAAGALAAVILLNRRPRIFMVLLPFALLWQWAAPVIDNSRASKDPSTNPAFYAPLIRELDARGGPPGRVEVVWTRGHWEAAVVARKYPIARGWERQLDNSRNSTVNGPDISPAAYRRWLDGLAVRWVAIATNAPVDSAAEGEAKLVRAGQPWLREIWKSKDWTLYEMVGPRPLSG